MSSALSKCVDSLTDVKQEMFEPFAVIYHVHWALKLLNFEQFVNHKLSQLFILFLLLVLLMRVDLFPFSLRQELLQIIRLVELGYVVTFAHFDL